MFLRRLNQQLDGMHESPPRRYWPSLTLLLLFGVSQANLVRIIGPLAPSFLEMQLAFSPSQYQQILSAWGPEGVARYQSHFFWDLFHPLLFGGLGWVTVRTSPMFADVSLDHQGIYRWLLPVAAGLDYIENTCQLTLLADRMQRVQVLVPLSASCATVKWGLAVAFVCVTVWQCLRWLIRPAAG